MFLSVKNNVDSVSDLLEWFRVYYYEEDPLTLNTETKDVITCESMDQILEDNPYYEILYNVPLISIFDTSNPIIARIVEDYY